jgi:hypothetical protein
MIRTIRRILLFVVLGAILNVAVAWGCAIWVVTDLSWSASNWFVCNAPAEWEYRRFEAPGMLRLNSNRSNESAITSLKYYAHRRPDDALPQRSPGPDWSRLSRSFKKSDAFRAVEDARGWPALTLFSVIELKGIDETKEWVMKDSRGFGLAEIWCTSSGIRFREGDSSDAIVTLPLRPIWPGFAINTVFYAFVLWLLFAAPFALRRWRRIRRGLCPKCAYDLRGSVGGSQQCPECGSP